jgi:protein ImuB
MVARAVQLCWKLMTRLKWCEKRGRFMTRILCLWFPNWAIQRAIRGRPELKGQAVALVAAESQGKAAPGSAGGLRRGSTNRQAKTPGKAGGYRRVQLSDGLGRAGSGTQSIVAVCCGKAVKQGIRPGMPLAEAQALARDLKVAVYEPAADQQALVKMAEACERFSPRVALEEGDEPESLLLDISNLEHLCGDEAKLVEQVEKFFRRRGYRVRLAVAKTVGAAWATAHFDSERAGSSSTPKLPVEALRIPGDTTPLLRELGIETIDQLLALPREALASRFGEDLLRRLDQLTGRGRELIEPRRGLPALAASYALEEPTGDRSVLMQVLGQLVDQLSRQLAARDLGAVLLIYLLRCTDGQEMSLRVGLLQPSANARQLLELVELRLETVRLAEEVDRVELRAVAVGRLGERQRELFAGRWPTDPHQLAVLVNRLSSRLGCERVLQAELRKSPVPERAVKWAAAVGKKEGERGRQGGKEKSRRSYSPRPLMLYSQPQARKVICVAPDGPPQCVWMNQRRERVLSCVGPERIETLWWRGASVRRDYYRVATESGEHLWMFRRLDDGKWFAHGEFA